MLVGTILAQYWTMSRSSVGVKTPMDNLVLAPLAIPIHQLRSTLSALEEKQSRLLRRSIQFVLFSMMELSSVGVMTLKDNWATEARTLI